jgi:hypothetical protein
MKPGSSTYQNLAIAVAATFLFSLIAADLMRVRVTQASLLDLPEPAVMVQLSRPRDLPVLKGLRLDPERPLNIQFVVSPGDNEEIDREEAELLVRYFLAGLTVPDRDLWVNLSPYEYDRITPDSLGTTDMGKDLLAQDYVLKQLLSSVTYPDSDSGRDFWNNTYERLAVELGTTAVPVNTFNKVWIIPGKIEVQECNNLALIAQAGLKAMMEEDYLALDQNAASIRSEEAGINDEQIERVNKITSSVMRETILPLIERDVNEGKNFARLRQVYHSLILSLWFKKKFADSFYRHYIDQARTQGIDLDDPEMKDKIYGLYVKAFEKGVYDLIRKTYDPAENKYVRRRYFSGGVQLTTAGSAIQNYEVMPEIMSRAISSNYRQLDIELKNAAYDSEADNTGGQTRYVEAAIGALYAGSDDYLADRGGPTVREQNRQMLQAQIDQVQTWIRQYNIESEGLKGPASHILQARKANLENLAKKIRSGMMIIRQYDMETFELQIRKPYQPLRPEVRRKLFEDYGDQADGMLANVLGRLRFELRGSDKSIEQAMGELTIEEFVEKSQMPVQSLEWNPENPVVPVDILMDQLVHVPRREGRVMDTEIIQALRDTNPDFRKTFDAWLDAETSTFEVDLPQVLEQPLSIKSQEDVESYARIMSVDLEQMSLDQMWKVKNKLITLTKEAMRSAKPAEISGYVRYLESLKRAFNTILDEQAHFPVKRSQFPYIQTTLMDIVNEIDVARYEAAITPDMFAAPDIMDANQLVQKTDFYSDLNGYKHELDRAFEVLLEGGNPAMAGQSAGSESSSTKGGIDLQGMDVKASAGSALMQFAPFDINDFRGFRFDILSMEKLDTEDKIQVLIQ